MKFILLAVVSFCCLSNNATSMEYHPREFYLPGDWSHLFQSEESECAEPDSE